MHLIVSPRKESDRNFCVLGGTVVLYASNLEDSMRNPFSLAVRHANAKAGSPQPLSGSSMLRTHLKSQTGATPASTEPIESLSFIVGNMSEKPANLNNNSSPLVFPTAAETTFLHSTHP